MANEEVPNSGLAPTQPWFARLGLSGKLLLIGGLIGIIVSFLPLVSVSIEMREPGVEDLFRMLGGLNNGGGQLAMNVNETVTIVKHWRGKVGLACYLAALLLPFVLYPPNGLVLKALSWAVVGASLLAIILAVWLLVLARDATGSTLITEGAARVPMANVKVTTGVGAYLNILAALVVLAGGFLKAREEKLL